jgi:hypothetical protein
MKKKIGKPIQHRQHLRPQVSVDFTIGPVTGGHEARFLNLASFHCNQRHNAV